MSARTTLNPDGTALPELLGRLAFRPEDAAAFTDCLRAFTDADWATVERLHGLLAARVGLLEDRPNPLHGEPIDHPLAPELLGLAALVAAAPQVQHELVRRGVTPDVAWRSVADLGQQVAVHRRVHGRFGFGTTGWNAPNFAGGLVWLGRLQYTLERDEVFSWVLGCHIPETGSLTPAAVDDSFRQARHLADTAFADFPISRITCESWLLDPSMVARLDPASNMARFAGRFTRYGTPRDGRRDALYFGFHRETRSGQHVDLASLPRATSLQRAVLAQLDAGGVVVQRGWAPLPTDGLPTDDLTG